MPNLNRVMLMGNLTRDVELKYTANNLAIGKLGLAVNRRWKSAEGEQKEEVTFIDCEAFGKTAENIAKFIFACSSSPQAVVRVPMDLCRIDTRRCIRATHWYKFGSWTDFRVRAAL